MTNDEDSVFNINFNNRRHDHPSYHNTLDREKNIQECLPSDRELNFMWKYQVVKNIHNANWHFA